MQKGIGELNGEMMKKALVVAPHPDDEINLAGQLIITLKKENVEVFVVYTTNGDATQKIGNARILEAIKANAVLGINSEHVFFMGYANEWQGQVHLYNAKEGEVLISKLGKTQTNSIEGHPEYCYQRYGIHHDFTRENFKKDYKDIIQFLSPDLIIAPEFDSHPDHRAASLTFDEVMGEILKENIDYRPMILKKYIHEGVWNGPKDYYETPAKTTLPMGLKFYAGQAHELESPAYHWSQRIRIKVDDATITKLLKDNIIYKAAKQHKVTTAWYEMQRVINADAVYWRKSVDNVALNAKFFVSSGKAKFLNDFKYYDTDDVNSKTDMFLNSSKYCWQPEPFDDERKIVCTFEREERVNSIVIVEDCKVENHVEKLLIKIGDCRFEAEPNCDGSRTEIVLSESVETNRIEFSVLNFHGQPGIAEIEVYSSIDEDVPFQKYADQNIDVGKSNITVSQIFEMAFFRLKFLFSFKLKYEFHRVIKKLISAFL